MKDYQKLPIKRIGFKVMNQKRQNEDYKAIDYPGGVDEVINNPNLPLAYDDTYQYIMDGNIGPNEEVEWEEPKNIVNKKLVIKNDVKSPIESIIWNLRSLGLNVWREKGAEGGISVNISFIPTIPTDSGNERIKERTINVE